jgi:outer membrane protein assembly factor BamE (lipoprotein component of BamABCDE complex)
LFVSKEPKRMKKAIASILVVVALVAAPTAYASFVSDQIIEAQLAVIRLNMRQAHAGMTSSQRQTVICNVARANRAAIGFYPLPSGC